MQFISKLREILDHNETLGYNINNLESPSRLEQVLISKKIDIAFPRKGNVVRLAKLTSGAKGEERLRANSLERKVNFLGILDFFTQSREAHARER